MGVLLVGLSTLSHAQLIYTLDDIINRAKGQSPAAKQAETRKETRYWEYRSFRAGYNPQLSLFGTLPNFTKDFVQKQVR